MSSALSEGWQFMAHLKADSPVLDTFTCASTLRVVRSLSDELPASIEAIAKASGVSCAAADNALRHLLALEAVSRLPGDLWQLRADGLRKALSMAYNACGF